MKMRKMYCASTIGESLIQTKSVFILYSKSNYDGEIHPFAMSYIREVLIDLMEDCNTDEYKLWIEKCDFRSDCPLIIFDNE